MTDSPSSVPWTEFSRDPREPGSAALRASDRDREVVIAVLADGYADGRLTKEEHDERLEAATATRTLGELPALIDDLVPQELPTGRRDLARATPEALHRQAVIAFGAHRSRAVVGFLVPTLICWTVWVLTGLGEGAGFHSGFPWPLFVMLGTGGNALRVLLNREGLIAEEEHRLQRRQDKRLERQERRRLSPPDAD
jgi:hypothetical protein